MISIMKSILTEYGIGWAINRGLYSIKLKMMSIMPSLEQVFERNIEIKRIDIFDFDVLAIRNFLEKLPADKKREIVAVAEKARNGIILGFSSIELDFGAPINWYYNPLTGMESRNDLKWYRIPDFDKKMGDIKVIWEASRFTHFFYLARAYLITGDRKYYDAFSEQLEEWLEQNPYPYGVNYKCSQECVLRMINVLMVYSIFKNCKVIKKKDELNVFKLVEASYKKVLSNFFYAHKCIKNNHTFTEICGLIIGAWCCEDEDGTIRAYKLLDREIQNQFVLDGGFTQYSFNYHRFVLQIIECIYKISDKTKLYITEEERIKNSVLLIYQVQNKNGEVPNYGSNDGALIFPVTSCGYNDYRPVLNTVYALIEGKRLYKPGEYDEELLWFTNYKDIPYENICRKSSTFNNSGFYTFRHNGGFLLICLQDFKSRPAHMDQLHIDLWHNEVNVLCDSGTYSYASDFSKNLSYTSGHNTVKIPGVEQMNKRSPFFITDWTICCDIKHNKTSFEGTMISKKGYKHTRRIDKKGNSYTIFDSVVSNSAFCEFYFHTPCEVKRSSSGLDLFFEDKLICSIEILNGSLTNKKAYRSLFYLKKEEINCIAVKCSIKNNMCNLETRVKLY